MGDGRYYTNIQFFNVLFLTIAIIFTIIAFMIIIYKESDYKKLIISSGTCLIITLLCRFVFEVIHGEESIVFFHRVTYIFLCIYILINTIMYHRIFRKRGKQIFLSIVFVCLLVFVLFVFQTYEKFGYLVFVMNFVLLSNNFVKYRISSSVFSDVKKLMLNYVFITNVNGEIIYKNDKVYSQNLFKDISNICVENLDDVFYNDIVIRNAFNKNVVKVLSENVMYFQYNKKEVYNKDILAGYIITFTDITKLISMLDDLKIKQEKTKKVNEELLKYKEFVYELEREKEINILLLEIANNQYKAMHQLKNLIELVDFECDFTQSIEDLIAMAKDDLSDVRNAVTAYMNYYDEA